MRIKTKAAGKHPKLTSSLINEFIMMYQYNLREFLYLFTSNEKDPIKLAGWIEAYRHVRKIPIFQTRGQIEFEIISENQNAVFRQRPIFTVIPSDSHQKQYLGFESPKRFLQNGFVLPGTRDKSNEGGGPKVFFKKKKVICRYDQGETLISSLHKILAVTSGANTTYKRAIKQKIHAHFYSIMNGPLLQEITKNHFSLKTYCKLKSIQNQIESQPRDIYTSIYSVVIDVEKILNKKANSIDGSEFIQTMTDLVDYTKKFLIIMATEMILDLNDKITEHLQTYLFSAPINLIDLGTPQLIDRRAYLSLDPKIALQLVERVKKRMGMYELNAQKMEELIELYSAQQISNEFEKDKFMIVQTVIELVSKNFKHKVHQILYLPPIIQINTQDAPFYTTKPNSLSTREARQEERKYCRSFLYSLEETDEKLVDERLLSFVEKTQHGESKYETADEEGIMNIFLNKKLFGWLNIEKFLLRPEQSFRSVFKRFVPLIFEHMTAIEKLDLTMLGSYSIESLQNKFTFKLSIPETSIQELFHTSKHVFKHSLVGIVSLLFIMDHFSFLFVQENTLIPDILLCDSSSTEQVEYLEEKLLSEIEWLKEDHKFISLQIPDEFESGIFKMSLVKFKKSCLKKVGETMNHLKDQITSKMRSILLKISKNLETINSTCSEVPDYVDEYISLKKKINSKQFENQVQQTINLSHEFEILSQALEKMHIVYDFSIIIEKIHLDASMNRSTGSQKEFFERFKSSKFNFYNEIILHRVELTNEFKEL